MTRNFSPVSKIAYIAILIAVIVFMIKLAYGWSIDQTAVFTSAVTGGQFADESAWLVQLMPQALLAIAAMAMAQRQRNLFYVLVVSALVINGIDAFTNIVTFQELWPTYSGAIVAQGRSAEFVEMTYPFGVALSFIVTWFEEGISLALGTALMLFGELAQEMGWRLPKFFRGFAVAARAAGGDFRGVQPGSHSQRTQHATGRG